MKMLGTLFLLPPLCSIIYFMSLFNCSVTESCFIGCDTLFLSSFLNYMIQFYCINHLCALAFNSVTRKVSNK